MVTQPTRIACRAAQTARRAPPIDGRRPQARPDTKGTPLKMQWRLRMAAAERNVWTAADLRRLLASKAHYELSAPSVAALMTREPAQVKLTTLAALCIALDCRPEDLLELDLGQRARQAPRPHRACAGTGVPAAHPAAGVSPRRDAGAPRSQHPRAARIARVGAAARSSTTGRLTLRGGPVPDGLGVHDLATAHPAVNAARQARRGERQPGRVPGIPSGLDRTRRLPGALPVFRRTSMPVHSDWEALTLGGHDSYPGSA